MLGVMQAEHEPPGPLLTGPRAGHTTGGMGTLPLPGRRAPACRSQSQGPFMLPQTPGALLSSNVREAPRTVPV